MEDELGVEDLPGYKIRHMIIEVTDKDTINLREFTKVLSCKRMLSCLLF